MLTNYHTHTTYCDGRGTPEEVVLSAISKGFDAIGFSGHGYTSFDERYCMHDPAGYRAELRRLKEKYGGKIQIYIGCEEDAFAPVDRTEYDYIICSSHYFYKNGKYYPIDSGPEYFAACLEAFGGDALALADCYYATFCGYLKARKPDIIGHFDLITKFDEMGLSHFFSDPDYLRLAERYALEALKSGAFFEVNTGAISRGYRTTPYPHRELLHLLAKNGARMVLSSDSHQADTLDCAFDLARQMLREAGFDCVYALYDGAFQKYPL